MGQHIRFGIFRICANAFAHVYSKARSLNFVLSLHLHPYSVYVSSKGSGDSAESLMLSEAIIIETGTEHLSGKFKRS